MGHHSTSGSLQPAQQESHTPPPTVAHAPSITVNQKELQDRPNGQVGNGSSDSVKPSSRPRKFLPQPIETSSRSSAGGLSKSTNTVPPTSEATDSQSWQKKGDARRRFLPEPVETTKASNYGNSLQHETQSQPHAASAGPRRFKPELIETNRQSVKGRDDKTFNQQEIGNENLRPNFDGTRLRPRQETYPRPSESKFSYASLLRRQEGRRHSFRVPELPSIPSNSSEASSDSNSSSPSAIKSCSESMTTTHAQTTLIENSKGELSEYLLALAARSAHRQLKEQALAAFPNEQVYEPVDHFAVDVESDESEDEPWKYPQAHHIKSRRESSADLSWELEYMRQHKEEAQQRLRIMISSGKPLFESMQSNPASIKNDRSPPMLGDDIVIPRSVSPEGTLCGKRHAGDDSQATQDQCNGCGGLWCASNHADQGRGSGLWKGTCQNNQTNGPRPSTLRTTTGPRDSSTKANVTKTFSLDLPRAQKTSLQALQRSQKPGTLKPNLLTSSTVLDEFNDGFVTQIYNYLSLGYPCVARYYDDELSRISGITVRDLRYDDLKTDARGYVVAPAHDSPVVCNRWRALRLYIQDWALQQPHIGEDNESTWGLPERKGSWAI